MQQISIMTKNLVTALLSWLSGKPMLVTVVLFSALNLNAQNVTPTVTDGNSYNYSKNGVYVDMSIGELAISTIKTSSQIITQGFLQPISIEQPCAVPTLVYFPNPVETEITINALDCDVIVEYIEVYDTYGKNVLVVTAIENRINLSAIGIGVYILRVYALEGKLLGNLKIVKTTV